MRFSKPNRYRVQQRSRPSNRCKHYNHPKLKYDTKDDATKAAEFMADKYKQPFRAFPCDHCRRWHVGRDHDTEEGESLAS